MAFDDVLFPLALTSGAAGPEFSTDVTEYASGKEGRNQNWSASRMTFDLGSRVVALAAAEQLVAFFRSRKGKARGFRIRDPLDSYSGAAGTTPTALDQALGTGDGALLTFQLTKTYSNGGQTEVRRITRPVSGTVLIAVDGAATVSGWTVNNSTGVVTFTSPPAAGKVLTSGFRFDVPARFDTDQIQPQTLGQGNVQLPPIPAVEIRE